VRVGAEVRLKAVASPLSPRSFYPQGQPLRGPACAIALGCGADRWTGAIIRNTAAVGLVGLGGTGTTGNGNNGLVSAPQPLKSGPTAIRTRWAPQSANQELIRGGSTPSGSYSTGS